MLNESKGSKVDGVDIWPRSFFIFVADYGQPDMSVGGILLGDDSQQFYRYRASEWRHGEVIGIGPGWLMPDGTRRPMPGISLGDVILFSRKHGTRLPGEMRYNHPTHSQGEDDQGLLIRVLDPSKCQAVCEDFVPWWDIQKSQLNPSNEMSG